MASYDVAALSNICQAHCPPRHATNFEPSSLELNGALPYDEATLSMTLVSRV